MVFYDTKFIFDGIDSTEKNIVLVDTEEKNILMNNSMSFVESVSSNATFNGVHLLKKENELPPKLTLEFCLVEDATSSNLIPAVWTREKEIEFYRWIQKEDFCKFTSYDNLAIHYYLKATKISKKFNYEKKGVYVVEFQSYYKTPTSEKVLNLFKKFNGQTLYSFATDNRISSLLFVFKNIEVDEITIQNHSIPNSKPFVLHNVRGLKKVIVDMSRFLVVDENNNNLFDKVKDRSWINLIDSGNRISITPDTVETELLYTMNQAI